MVYIYLPPPLHTPITKPPPSSYSCCFSTSPSSLFSSCSLLLSSSFLSFSIFFFLSFHLFFSLPFFSPLLIFFLLMRPYYFASPSSSSTSISPFSSYSSFHLPSPSSCPLNLCPLICLLCLPMPFVPVKYKCQDTSIVSGKDMGLFPSTYPTFMAQWNDTSSTRKFTKSNEYNHTNPCEYKLQDMPLCWVAKASRNSFGAQSP